MYCHLMSEAQWATYAAYQGEIQAAFEAKLAQVQRVYELERKLARIRAIAVATIGKPLYEDAEAIADIMDVIDGKG